MLIPNATKPWCQIDVNDIRLAVVLKVLNGDIVLRVFSAHDYYSIQPVVLKFSDIVMYNCCVLCYKIMMVHLNFGVVNV